MRNIKGNMKRNFCAGVLLTTFLFVPACGCSEKPGNANKDAGMDAAVDGSVDADALTDASIDGAVEAGRKDADPPDAFVFHDCMAPLEVEELKEGELYQVPVMENPSDHGGFAWNGRYLIQSDKRCEWPEYDFTDDLYGIDVETMEERLLVGRARLQTQPSIYEASFVFRDSSFQDADDPNNNYRSELMLFNLITNQEARLTDSNEGKTQPRFNGTHVLYMNYNYTEQYVSYKTLRLLDIATGEETVLATEDEGITQSNLWDINQEYAAWRASPEGENGWDIFLHHIPTGQTSRLNTPGEYIINLRFSNTRLGWTEKRNGNWAVYMVELATMNEQEVASGNSDKVLSGLADHFVSWRDYERAGCNFPCVDSDRFIKDLQTGIERRLTPNPGKWTGSTPMNCRWLLYFEFDSSTSFRVFLWDVVAAGILDENCNIIPCDPDNEECTVLEWIGP